MRKKVKVQYGVVCEMLVSGGPQKRRCHYLLILVESAKKCIKNHETTTKREFLFTGPNWELDCPGRALQTEAEIHSWS